MTDFKQIEYEKPEPNIARIWLNRPDAANAQGVDMLYELNRAFDMAIYDNEVKSIILAARGKHFSSGHDINYDVSTEAMAKHKTVGTWTSDNWVDPEGYYAREKEIYEGFFKKWQSIPKPTIAQVQGKAISGALLLIWPMDFIVASEEASFQDNTILMGICGIEYFAHAFELGIRRAKEFLMLAKPISSAEAKQIGMVNKVVSRESLEEETLNLARELANRPTFAMKLVKDLLNATYETQGQGIIQKAAFNAHHLAHTHYRLTQGEFADLDFLKAFWQKSSKK